jgi:hypothetical protein
MSNSSETCRTSGSAFSLAAIQRWMQNVIVHPEGVAAGIRSEEARQHADITESNLEELILPSQALTSAERLSIYSHAYSARLLECLRAAYPTLLHALGNEAFDSLALGYLRAYPSRSYTLDKLGTHFSQFLEATRPDRIERSESRRSSEASWPDFLIDLARFDWAVGEVFDRAGAEGQPLLSAPQIAAVPPEHWPYARLVPTPSLRLLVFRYPINAYFSALRADDGPRLPEPDDTYLALTRRDYVVCRHELLQAQYGLLGALVAGATIGEAISHCADLVETTDLDRFTGELREWFRHWTSNEFFQAIR